MNIQLTGREAHKIAALAAFADRDTGSSNHAIEIVAANGRFAAYSGSGRIAALLEVDADPIPDADQHPSVTLPARDLAKALRGIPVNGVCQITVTEAAWSVGGINVNVSGAWAKLAPTARAIFDSAFSLPTRTSSPSVEVPREFVPALRAVSVTGREHGPWTFRVAGTKTRHAVIAETGRFSAVALS